MSFKSVLFLVVVIATLSMSAEVIVDDRIPARNIIVLNQSENEVRLRQDQRDTKEEKWFYWGFRVSGAAGKTIRFVFPDQEPAGGPVDVRGLGRDIAKVWRALLETGE